MPGQYGEGVPGADGKMTYPWGGGPSPSPGYYGTPPPPMTNTVKEDPYLTENIDWIRQRRDASNAEGQKQRAYGDIDQMAQANSKNIEGMMARRGIGGSGIAIEGQQKNLDSAARAKVRAGMDIDQQEQARQDNLALMASNIMRAPSAYNLGQQQANLGQWQAQANQNNWLAQFQAQQQQNQTQNYMDLYKMFGQVPGGQQAQGGVPMGGLGNGGSVYDDPWFQSFLPGYNAGGSGSGFGGR